jgi:hypothetical protein
LKSLDEARVVKIEVPRTAAQHPVFGTSMQLQHIEKPSLARKMFILLQTINLSRNLIAQRAKFKVVHITSIKSKQSATWVIFQVT